MVKRSPDANQIERVKSEIGRLRTLGLDELRMQWRNAFSKRAAPSFPKGLMVKILAYRIQAVAFGDIDPRVLRIVTEHASSDYRPWRRENEDDGDAASRISNSRSIKPGSVLMRECAGRMHRIMVLDGGFAWEGKTYRSLSQVARAITGTRWNGRRFFGVDRQSEGPGSSTVQRAARTRRVDGRDSGAGIEP